MNKDILIAGTASFLNGLILAPLDMVTTRSKSINSSLTSFKLIHQIYKNDGVRALWRGSAWYIFAQMVSRGIWLSSYNIILDESKSNIIFASGVAGLLTSAISNSIWNIKTHAQLPCYTGFKNVVFDKYGRFNTRVLTYGLYSSCILVTIESIAHLYTYEMLKEHVQSDSPIINSLLGGIGRVSILPFTYPLHVINLRYREQTNILNKPKLLDVWRGICKQRAWYAGATVYTCKVAPQSILLFFIYESCKKYL